MAVHMRLYPDWGQRVIRRQPIGGPYERYALSVAREIIAGATVVFKTFNKRGNEGETSEFTPPKYLASFRTHYYRATMLARASNHDPGWHLVEWGSHPGGGETRVLRYKPLTRGLLIVGSRFKGR